MQQTYMINKKPQVISNRAKYKHHVAMELFFKRHSTVNCENEIPQNQDKICSLQRMLVAEFRLSLKAGIQSLCYVFN